MPVAEAKPKARASSVARGRLPDEIPLSEAQKLQPEQEHLGNGFRKNVNFVASRMAALVERGYRLCSGGTDNHLMLVDLQPRDAALTGADAERWLESAGIITNKNGIPNDPRPPMVTSGLRLGASALTTRGFDEDAMVEVAELLDRVMGSQGDESTCRTVREEVRALCSRYPLPH